MIYFAERVRESFTHDMTLSVGSLGKQGERQYVVKGNGAVSLFSSVAQSCLTLCNPMNRSTPGLPVHHQHLEFSQTPIKLVMPSSHLILCCPLLLLPPISHSIRVFSSESTLHIRWPEYWSFSFNISPSNKHPGLI